MTTNDLRAFLERVAGDAALQQRLQTANDLDAVIAIAREEGFTLSARELASAQAAQTVPLSDAELEHMTGGVGPYDPVEAPQPQTGLLFYCPR